MGRRKRIQVDELNGGRAYEEDAYEIPQLSPKDLFNHKRPPLSPTQDEMLQSVKEAFDTGVLDILTKRERDCFTDNIISGDSMAEIAARYKISNFTVHAYVQKAAKKIRLFIESNYGRD